MAKTVAQPAASSEEEKEKKTIRDIPLSQKALAEYGIGDAITLVIKGKVVRAALDGFIGTGPRCDVEVSSVKASGGKKASDAALVADDEGEDEEAESMMDAEEAEDEE